MPVSHSKRFIFVHVYKVAGTSVTTALAPYLHRPERLLVNRLLHRVGIDRSPPHHRYRSIPVHAKARQLRQELPPRIFDGYFKFAFVRNPWDWQVSLYEYTLQTPSHHEHELVRSLGSFDAYVRWRVEGHAVQQNSFVTDDDGRRIVDFVGRFEELPRDFGEVCRRIGVRSALPHANATRRATSDRYYTAEIAGLVASAFAEDIETFGYDRCGPGVGV